jgi:hypothetical protein
MLSVQKIKWIFRIKQKGELIFEAQGPNYKCKATDALQIINNLTLDWNSKKLNEKSISVYEVNINENKQIPAEIIKKIAECFRVEGWEVNTQV